MNKLKMKATENLEFLATSIMMPLGILEKIFDDPFDQNALYGKEREEYISQIDDFVFEKEKNYNGFCDFLELNKDLFKKHYHLLKKIDDFTIDYIFKRIREERIQSVIDSINEGH